MSFEFVFSEFAEDISCHPALPIDDRSTLELTPDIFTPSDLDQELPLIQHPTYQNGQFQLLALHYGNL